MNQSLPCRRRAVWQEKARQERITKELEAHAAVELKEKLAERKPVKKRAAKKRVNKDVDESGDTVQDS